MSDTCFIHIDLDTIDEIYQCYGLANPTKFESDPAYEEGLQNFLELFREFNVKSTLFTVAQDVLNSRHCEILKRAIDGGHEIANHSLSHSFNLTSLSEEDICVEIIKSHNIIKSNLGVECVGFRAPGYNISENYIKALSRTNYKYNSSLLPTFYGFLFRIADKILSGKAAPDKQQFGSFSNGFKPNYPFKIIGTNLWELPITTSPTIRFPIHSTMAHTFGEKYIIQALSQLKENQYHVLYLFHAVDLVDTIKLDIFKGKKSPAVFSSSYADKLKTIKKVLYYIKDNFNVVLSKDWIAEK